MIEPDLLSEVLHHPLVDDPGKERVIRRGIVVAAHQIHLAAPDPLAIGARDLVRGEGKVAHDPEHVVRGDPLVDRLDQRLVVSPHRFRRHLPPPAGILPRPFRPGRIEEGPAAILDDVAMAEMEVGGEPEPGHGRRVGRCGEEGWIRKGKSNRKNQWCESGKIENVRKPKARVASPPEVDFSDPPMPPSATDPQTGVTFRNGTLCLAKGLVEMRITGSPVPRSVMRRGRSGAWEDFFPEFRLVFPYRPAASAGRAMTAAKKPGSQMLFEFFDEVVSPPCDRPLTPAQQRKRAFEQFRFSLPKRTARILEPFRTHQWQLLVLLHHDPDAAELAESNPALAFALAQKLQADRDSSPRSAAAACASAISSGSSTCPPRPRR